MQKVDEIISKFKGLTDFKSGTGVNVETIKLAEERLGLNFSPQFKYFLQSYGWIEVNGYEIFGLIDDKFMGLDVVSATEDFRYFEGYSNELIILCNLDEEDVALDYTSMNSNGEPRVTYNTITGKIESAAEDFVSFLEMLYDEI